MANGGLCAWCGKPLRGQRTVFCSHGCKMQWTLTGRGPSLAQVEARLDHAASQPRGHYETVEAFLAAGGKIYRETG